MGDEGNKLCHHYIITMAILSQTTALCKQACKIYQTKISITNQTFKEVNRIKTYLHIDSHNLISV